MMGKGEGQWGGRRSEVAVSYMRLWGKHMNKQRRTHTHTNLITGKETRGEAEEGERAACAACARAVAWLCDGFEVVVQRLSLENRQRG